MYILIHNPNLDHSFFSLYNEWFFEVTHALKDEILENLSLTTTDKKDYLKYVMMQISEKVVYQNNSKFLDKWIKKVNKAKTVAVDTETTGLNYMDAKLVGVSLSTKPGEAAYIPFGHAKEEGIKQLSEKTVLEKLKPFLEDKKKSVLISCIVHYS